MAIFHNALLLGTMMTVWRAASAYRASGDSFYEDFVSSEGSADASEENPFISGLHSNSISSSVSSRVSSQKLSGNNVSVSQLIETYNSNGKIVHKEEMTVKLGKCQYKVTIFCWFSFSQNRRPFQLHRPQIHSNFLFRP